MNFNYGGGGDGTGREVLKWNFRYLSSAEFVYSLPRYSCLPRGSFSFAGSRGKSPVRPRKIRLLKRITRRGGSSGRASAFPDSVRMCFEFGKKWEINPGGYRRRKLKFLQPPLPRGKKLSRQRWPCPMTIFIRGTTDEFRKWIFTGMNAFLSVELFHPPLTASHFATGTVITLHVIPFHARQLYDLLHCAVRGDRFLFSFWKDRRKKGIGWNGPSAKSLLEKFRRARKFRPRGTKRWLIS